MRTLIKRLTKLHRKFVQLVMLFLNKNGDKRQCNICGNTFNNFIPYKGGTKKLPEFRRMLMGVGSDLDNFGCVYCKAHDRERHLFLYFERIRLWEKMKEASIIHFAPERKLRDKIKEIKPAKYIMGDLYPTDDEIEIIDATNIKYADESFNILICNHVLEHIPDYRKALSEFYRILKPGGIAILQTPFSRLLKYNFEDENINTEELRLYFYGQEDHVRNFGEFEFLKSIEDSGFKLDIKKHNDFITSTETLKYGVNPLEDLIYALKY